MAETRFENRMEDLKEELERASRDLTEAQKTIQKAQELIVELQQLDRDHTAHLAEYNRWNTKALIREGNKEPNHIIKHAIQKRDEHIRPVLETLDVRVTKSWDLLDIMRALEAGTESPAELFREKRLEAAAEFQVAEKTYQKQKERMDNLNGKLK